MDGYGRGLLVDDRLFATWAAGRGFEGRWWWWWGGGREGWGTWWHPSPAIILRRQSATTRSFLNGRLHDNNLN